MDDGSTLSLLGWLTDVTEGHISAGDILVQGGNCGGPANGLPNVIIVSGLDRQS